MCKLCELKPLTKRYYECDNYIIVDCITCKVPMIVLKEHRKYFTKEEKQIVIALFKLLFGDGLKGVDFKMRSIPDHAHAHLR